jgi:hypothetical protein
MLDRLDVQRVRVWAAIAANHVPEIVLNTSEPDVIYARVDIEGANRWNPSMNRWIPLHDRGPAADAQNPSSLMVRTLDPWWSDTIFFRGTDARGDSQVFGRANLAINGDGITYGDLRAQAWRTSLTSRH